MGLTDWSIIEVVAWMKLWAVLFPRDRPEQSLVDRSDYERLAIPHSFKPRLSLGEAVVATLAALLRIFFGSLLFAVWGTYTLLAWSRIPNYLWRAVVLFPLFLLFLLSMVLLMSAIAALRRMIPHRHP